LEARCRGLSARARARRRGAGRGAAGCESAAGRLRLSALRPHRAADPRSTSANRSRPSKRSLRPWTYLPIRAMKSPSTWSIVRWRRWA